jgi:predicted DNA-binding transcriptional regulator YafY
MNNLLDYNNFSKLNENDSNVNYVMLRESYNDTMTKLENAITNKFECTIYYKGEIKGVVDDGYRYIEPYALGVNKQGNTVLRAWLKKGMSRSGKIDPSLVPGWRLFRIDRISIITPTLAKFTTPRKGYNSEDNGMTEINFAAKF